MLRNALSKYEDWIHNSYLVSNDQLGIFRILYSGLMIFLVGVPRFAYRMAQFPDGAFNPPPFFKLFATTIPPNWFFQGADWIIIVGILMVFFGFRTRLAGIITALLIIIGNGFIFSTGKIDHSFMAWFTLLMLSFSGWENSFSVDSLIDKSRSSKDTKPWTITLVSMGLGFGFFTAGMIKLLSGWLSFSDSMLRSFFLRNYHIQGKQDLLAPIFENLEFSLFWESGDWFTIFFEIGFLVVIFYPRLFRFFTLLAMFFHGAVLLMMNIGFLTYIPLYLLFWVPLIPAGFIAKFNKRFQSFLESKTLLVAFVFLVIGLSLVKSYFLYDYKHSIGLTLVLGGFVLSLYLMLFKSRWIFMANPNKSPNGTVWFDGVCNLCNNFVTFSIKRDKDNYLKFGALQTGKAKDAEFDTIQLEQDGVMYEKSRAFLEIVTRFKGLWPYLYFGVLIPKFIRDKIYDTVAKNRYKWFGKKDVCMIPTPELKDKFVS